MLFASGKLDARTRFVVSFPLTPTPSLPTLVLERMLPMSRTGAVRHIHQYFKMENGLWYCSGIDQCTHFSPRNMPPPVGKLSKCWGCGKPFQLTPVNMENDKPECDKCTELSEVIGTRLGDIPVERHRNPYQELLRRAELNKQKELEEKDEVEVIEPENKDE